MDRTRPAHAGAAPEPGGSLSRPWLPLLLVVAACSQVFGDFDRLFAIVVVGPTTQTVEEGDTLRLEARAEDAAGDPIEDAVVLWELIDVDSGQVGFTLDGERGLVVAEHPGQGRIQARVDELRSDPITIVVTPAPDSLAAASDERVSVPSGTDTSPFLVTAVFDLTTTPGEQLALPDIDVHYEVVAPPAGDPSADGLFLVVGDTLAGDDPRRVSATTAADGTAGVTARIESGAARPDSAVIDAVALTAVGDTVPGSPVRFVVVFQNE